MTWRASPAGFLVLECGRDLNALARYFRGGTAVEQIVGRERYQRACLRHLVRNPVASRRVNSDVRHLPWRANAIQTLNDLVPALNFRRVRQPSAKLQTLQTSIGQGNQDYR